MSDNITKRVGLGTAYGFAKAGGYEGTVAEFTELLGNIAIDLARIENLSVTVTTLPAGSQATASLNGSVLSLGIPKGDTGATGATGETGAPAGFGTVSATVDDTIGTPSVEVTASGADTAKNFAFAFHNLKGEKGDKGDTGDVTLSQLEDFTVVQTDENVEPYNFRATPKCGHIERLGKVVGVSVAFNQLFPFDSDSWEIYGLLVSVNNGRFVLSGTASQTGTSALFPSRIYNQIKLIYGHKYLLGVSGTHDFADFRFVIYGSTTSSMQIASPATPKILNCAVQNVTDAEFVSNYISGTAYSADLQTYLIDLTLALGSTIADYVYSLEQATAGAGVAWLKQHFPKMFGQYNAYDAGSIRSVEGVSEHKVVGKNLFDVQTMLPLTNQGYIGTDGEAVSSASGSWLYTEYIPIVGKSFVLSSVSGNAPCIALYDANKNLIVAKSYNTGGADVLANVDISAQTNASFARFSVYTGADKSIIQLERGSTATDYEPYTVNSYPLDSDLTLRGMLKISNGNLYADGDEYGADGSVSRRYGVVDLGSLEWIMDANVFRTAPSNMARPAGYIERKDGFICSKYPADTQISIGYEQMTDKSALRGDANIYIKDTAYSDATAFKTAMNGVYLVYELATPTAETADPFTENQICEAGGTEEFVSTSIVPIGHETEYPLTLSDIRPTANGNYVLKCTVSNGKASYEWVSA